MILSILVTISFLFSTSGLFFANQDTIDRNIKMLYPLKKRNENGIFKSCIYIFMFLPKEILLVPNPSNSRQIV